MASVRLSQSRYPAAVSCRNPDLGQRELIVDKQSMRGFLAMVERDFPDELVRIRTG
jgi:hypothetical protein